MNADKAARFRRKAGNGERVFLSQERMRRIRWEESLVNASLKRDPPKKPMHIVHWSCACGSVDCLASPMAHRLHVAGGNSMLWSNINNEYGQ